MRRLTQYQFKIIFFCAVLIPLAIAGWPARIHADVMLPEDVPVTVSDTPAAAIAPDAVSEINTDSIPVMSTDTDEPSNDLPDTGTSPETENPEAGAELPAAENPIAGVPASPAETVVVEGFGAVVAGDIAAARDEAIADARRMAIEQVAGVKSAFVSEVTGGIMTRDEVLTETDGIILDTRIIDEGMYKDEMYRVQAGITVATDPLQAMMFRFAPRDRVALFVEHTGFEVDNEPVAMAITRRLIEAGYKVPDPETILSDDTHDLVQAFRTGARQVLPALGLAWGCPAVIEGSVSVDEPRPGSVGTGCRGVVNLRMLSTETGEILAQICSGDTITGFGKNPDLAAVDMIRRMAAHCVQAVEKTLVPDSLQSIKMRVRGLPGTTDYRDLINAIHRFRFVRSITHQEPWNAYLTKFTVNTESESSVLAQHISGLPGVSVTSITENEIEINYEGR